MQQKSGGKKESGTEIGNSLNSISVVPPPHTIDRAVRIDEDRVVEPTQPHVFYRQSK